MAEKCDILLEKLQRGQTDLRRSLRLLNRSPDGRGARVCGSKRRFPVVRRERELRKVDELPKKRARLAQLSPDWQDPHTPSSTPPHRHPSTPPHRRRLSSTPKHPSAEPPSLDVSLEEAILNGRQLSKTGAHRTNARPRERVSKVAVDTYRSLTGPPEMRSRKPRNDSLEKRKRSEKRGLTVSFVQEPTMGDAENETNFGWTPYHSGTNGEQRSYQSDWKGEQKSNHSDAKGKQRSYQSDAKGEQKSNQSDVDLEQSLLQSVNKSRSRRRDGYTEQTSRLSAGGGLDGRLVDTLNASRFGALENHVSHTRTRRKFPRRYAGDDPALGYDWIAGLLDSDSYLGRHDDDDDFFRDIKEFRRVNRSECVQPTEALLPGSLVGGVPPRQTNPEASNHDDETSHNTTCVASFVLNDRLFPVPLHSAAAAGEEEECPVCLDRPGRDPSPSRYIRVSVPRCVLQPSARLAAHRRRSFNPSDSMAIGQHCLAGWESAQPACVPPQPGAGLSASLRQPQRLAATASQKRTGQLLNTSLAVQYSLQPAAH